MKTYGQRILTLITHVTDANENTTEIKSSFTNVKINAADEDILAAADIVNSLMYRGADTVRVSLSYEYDI